MDTADFRSAPACAGIRSCCPASRVWRLAPSPPSVWLQSASWTSCSPARRRPQRPLCCAESTWPPGASTWSVRLADSSAILAGSTCARPVLMELATCAI
uniref:Uncharacterized protein n=1 Tax=Macrostomum lignano TaxID=282301 RepID=A0A1I8F4A6_9PLAT